MPALGHSLGSRNPRNIERRQERARQVLHRIPIELGAAVLGLRRQRVVLEGLLATAAQGGDTMAACRVSDSLVKIADLFSRLAREGASKRGQEIVVHEVEPIGSFTTSLEEENCGMPDEFGVWPKTAVPEAE